MKGYKDGEYEKYVEGCKSMGFTDVGVNINNDTVNKIEAYSADNKYFVSLQLLKDERQVLNITCGKRSNTN